MTNTPRFRREERPAKVQEALTRIGSWLLNTVKTEPGWNELVFDIKPLSGTIFARITETRDEQDYVGSVGPIKEDSIVIPEIENLQHAAYDEHEGTWFTATVIVTAENWPEPDYQIGAAYNRQDEPQDWEGEGRMSRQDVRYHLEHFPRHASQIPQWAQLRLSGRLKRDHEPNTDSCEVPNPYLSEALSQTRGKERSDATVVNVLRASLGGDFLLDISDSTFVPAGSQKIGPRSTIRYRVLRLANDMRALCLYSSSEYVKEFHARFTESSSEPEILREHAFKVYLDFLADKTCDVVVIDPGTEHETFIEKPQVAWVLSTPHNIHVKSALLDGDMQRLLAALTAPSSVLLMGVRAGEEAPLFVPVPEGQEPQTMLVFTSAAEVASVDPQLQVRSAPAMEVLEFAQSLGADGVRINALSPSATLPMAQIQELLEIVRSAQHISN
ncbi:SseB family protein [Rothia sp. P7181]|uniref:SseB family protein n=1 Tax=Rothia sp. P7181 TaxID=3402663 RepID=UPI003AE20DF6